MNKICLKHTHIITGGIAPIAAQGAAFVGRAVISGAVSGLVRGCVDSRREKREKERKIKLFGG